MEKEIEDQLFSRLNIYSRPVKVGQSLPIAIINLLKPVISRFVNKLRDLKENEPLTLDILKYVLFNVSTTESSPLSNDVEAGIPSVLRHVNASRESQNGNAFINDIAIKESLKTHLFPSFDEFPEHHQLKVILLVDFLLLDLMDSVMEPYFNQHVPMKYVNTIGSSICEDDNDNEDESESKWAYYLTPSFLYSLILFDEFSSRLYFPSIYEKILKGDGVVRNDVSFIQEISESNLSKFELILSTPILLKLVEGMPSPFDLVVSFDTQKKVKETRELKQLRLLRRQSHLKYVLIFRLLDHEFLEHYQDLLLNHFPWTKLFYPSSSTEQKPDYLWDKIEFPEMKANYLSVNNFFSSSYLFRGDGTGATDKDYHETWPGLATFMRICQEIFLLYDFSRMNLSDGNPPSDESTFKKWIELIIEHFPKACESQFLVKNSGKVGSEGEDAHNNRMKSQLLFVALNKSIFTVSDSSYSQISPIIVIELENFRKLLVEQYFKKPSSLQVSRWMRLLIKQGNGFFLEAISNIFTSIKSPPFSFSSSNDLISQQEQDQDEDKEISSFLKQIFFGDSEELLSMICKHLDEQYLFYLCDRETMIAYLKGLQRLYSLTTGKTNTTNLFDHLLFYKGSVYSSLAHFLVHSSFFLNDKRKFRNDEDNEIPDDHENEEKNYYLQPLTAIHWLQIFYDDLQVNLDGKYVDIDNYQLPLLSYAINSTHLSRPLILEIVQFLVLEAKVNMNHIGSISDGNDQLYVTPLCLSVLRRNMQVIDFLLKNGALTTQTNAESPLLFILQKKIHQLDHLPPFSLPILQRLLQAGADLNEYKSRNYYDADQIYEEALPLLSINKRQRID